MSDLVALAEQLVRVNADHSLTADERTARDRALRAERLAAGGGALLKGREMREAVQQIVSTDGLADHDADRLLGAIVRAEAAYGDSRALVEGTIVPLVEQPGENGNARIKIVQPGWGASGYYSAEMLRRDGPRVFAAGTHMLWNHPTVREENERPWGSLYDLAGTLTENAAWEEKAPAGPGLYANARIFGSFRERLAELADDIGISLRAYGRGRQGEAEGKTGTIVDELVEAISVDFVPRAGAGGKVVALFESARRPIPTRELAGYSASELRELLTTGLRAHLSGEHRWIWVVDFTDSELVYEDEGDDAPDPGYFQVAYTVSDTRQPSFAFPAAKVTRKTIWVPVAPPTAEGAPAPTNDQEVEMSKELEARVAELEQQNATLTAERDTARVNEQRAVALVHQQEARAAAAQLLAEEKIPAAAKSRIVEQIAAVPPVKDGTLDRDQLAAKVSESVKAEGDYIASVTGSPVRELGDTSTPTSESELDELRARQQKAFERLGMSEASAKVAARR